jgi:hypothetical protein
MKHEKLTNEEIREKMETTIRDLYDTIQRETEAGKKANLANAMTNMIARYKEMFGVEQVDPVKLRSVKNF